MNNLLSKMKNIQEWTVPEMKESIPHGDMPGDKVQINAGHIRKANMIFPKLCEEIEKSSRTQENKKIVVTVCGGSGVGKSEIASLLSYYLNEAGIGCYTLSGDNYPHRIPMYNDAERLRIYRQYGYEGLLKKDLFTKQNYKVLHDLQISEMDSDLLNIKQEPWLEVYYNSGKEGLKQYLGSASEIRFEELETIVSSFKSGQKDIYLRRMGRECTEVWYEKIDFADTEVLIIEWTHGNSDNYSGVDIPILLNSTPQETMEHRKARNRDSATDSAFTTLVLEIEQNLLRNQAHKAKIIVSKDGELLSLKQYEIKMNGGSNS